MSLVISSFPPLPIGVKNGVGGVIGNKLYVGLGSAGTRLFFYDLDAPIKGWQRASEFPGTTRNDAAFSVCDDKLYVFSGAGQPENSTTPIVLEDSYVFDAKRNRWQSIETHIPVGLLGASMCQIEIGKLICFGGYSKETFDRFVAEISQIDPVQQPEKHQATLTKFMSGPTQDYGWNQTIWLFDCANETWSEVGLNPYLANCGAGIIQQNNTVTLIEGEIKPGLRSLESKVFEFDNGDMTKSRLLPSICNVDTSHEGLAGHFAGQVEKQIIVAGGAYFIGSQNKFQKGQWYSHQGLTKHYDNKVWQFDGTTWHQVMQLPHGTAYGVSISHNNTMYLLGGEDSKGDAQARCYTLSWRTLFSPINS